VIGKLIEDIKNGSPLSHAMANHPKVFSPLTVKLVVSGEYTGEMDTIVSRLADHLEKRASLKSQTVNAMIYPATVVLAGLGVGAFLVLKIIPQFAKFLLGRGKPLPPSTQMLVDTSNFFINNGVYLLALLGLMIFALVTMYKQPVGRFKLDGIMLKVPVLGKLLTTAAMAQLNWSLSMLLRSGLTVLDALKIVADATGNRVISTHLVHASGQILGGRDMASSIHHPAIPKLVTQMVAVGERTGTLDAVLSEMATYYEQLLQVQIKRLSSLVEPALILVIGGMVGFVYFSFFQALFALQRG
jgi:type IV pilus assembly protein PilC